MEQAKNGEETIHFLEVRTVLAFNRGEPAQALAYATSGWQLGQTDSPPDVRAYALIGIGHAQRQLGEWAAAAVTRGARQFKLPANREKPPQRLFIEPLRRLLAVSGGF